MPLLLLTITHFMIPIYTLYSLSKSLFRQVGKSNKQCPFAYTYLSVSQIFIFLFLSLQCSHSLFLCDTLIYSVTRLGDLLHIGQLFKACGNNQFTQITHNLGNFCKGVESFLGNFYRHLATFTGHTVYIQRISIHRRMCIQSVTHTLYLIHTFLLTLST